MEIVTGKLGRDEIVSHLPRLGGWLKSHGFDHLTVEYGWGCALALDELWKPLAMSPENLEAFISESEAKGVYRLATCDLILRGPEDKFELTLCHESDLHFASQDEDLVLRIAGLWQRERFPVSKRVGVREWASLEEVRP